MAQSKNSVAIYVWSVVPWHRMVRVIVAAGGIADCGLDVDDPKIIVQLRVQDRTLARETINLQQVDFSLKGISASVLHESGDLRSVVFFGTLQEVVSAPAFQLYLQRMLDGLFEFFLWHKLA